MGRHAHINEARMDCARSAMTKFVVDENKNPQRTRAADGPTPPPLGALRQAAFLLPRCLTRWDEDEASDVHRQQAQAMMSASSPPWGQLRLEAHAKRQP